MGFTWKSALGLLGLILLLAAAQLGASGAAAAWWAGALLAGAALIVWYLASAREEVKRLLTARSLRHGTNAVVLTAAVIGIVVLMNVIADQRHFRWDVTASGRHSLSPMTKEVLAGLEDDVRALVFTQEGDARGRRMVELLREYQFASPRFRYEVIDPNRHPSVANEYRIQLPNTVVFESGENRRTVESWDIFTSGNPQTGAAPEFRGEQAFTRALLEVTEGPAGSVVFLTGHGERNINLEYQQIRRQLEGEGYQVEERSLARQELTGDEAVVVLPGPRTDYAPEELQALAEYFESGGSLFIMLDAPNRGDALPNLAEWLAGYGVLVHDDIVVDPERALIFDPLTMVPELEFHRVTRDLMFERLEVLLPLARSLEVKRELPESVEANVFLRTSPAAWGSTQWEINPFEPVEGDRRGRLALGVAVTYAAEPLEPIDLGYGEQTPTPPSRMLIVGSGAWAINDFQARRGNRDLFLNGVNWLAGREHLISIRPHTEDVRFVFMTGAEGRFVFYTTVLILPALALLAGGVTWWRRRNL